MEIRDSYYYSGDRRIELTPVEELVALDLAVAQKASVGGEEIEHLMKNARQLSGSLYLIERDRLAPGMLNQIDQLGARQPVFKHGSTMIVVLPEVRAETSPGMQKLLFGLLQKEDTVPAEIVEETGRSLVLRPKSGRGMDALHLANQLYEHADMVMALPRFIRLVQKPMVKSP